MKITLTEALKEIKTLDSRIAKATSQVFIGCSKKNDVVVYPKTNKTKAELSEDIKSAYQSVNDLLTRRTTIKTALMEANAKVQVTVNKQPMSIATAIEMKNSISFKQELLKQLQRQYSSALNEIQKADAQVLERYDDTIGRMMEGRDSKVNSNDFSVIRTNFEEQLSLTAVDPLGLESKIKELEEEIEGFLSNVDTVLSIANATNFVEL